MFWNLAHVWCTCNTADWYQARWFRPSWQCMVMFVQRKATRHEKFCNLLVSIVLSKTDPIPAASPKLWYCISVKPVLVNAWTILQNSSSLRINYCKCFNIILYHNWIFYFFITYQQKRKTCYKFDFNRWWSVWSIWWVKKSFNWLFNNMMDQINEELCQERDKGSNESPKIRQLIS